MKPNTPIARGPDCTALVLVPRDARRRLIERLQAKRAEERNSGGLAHLLRSVADAALCSVASKVAYNHGARERGLPEQSVGADDLATLLYAMKLHEACDELEEPGEN